MTDAATAAGLAEIRALRERLARLEALATNPPETGDTMEQSLAARPAPPDAERRALENAAHGWQPDPQAEAALAARARDPERFDREYAAMHGDALALSLYAAGREAAIALGTFTPTEA